MAETFELTMLEGRVVVTGPASRRTARWSRGERLLRLGARRRSMALEHGGRSARRRRLPHRSPAAPPQVGAPPPAPRCRTARPQAARQAGGALRTAVERIWPRRGKYRDAFAAAEAAGFGQEIERAPAGDLLLLADAARFSGSPARAREALLAARRRFGVRGQSAFLLGKIAADQQGSPGDAVGWFETYLREEPGGPLAEQALGRIVDLARRGRPRGRAARRGPLPRALPGRHPRRAGPYAEPLTRGGREAQPRGRALSWPASSSK